MKVEKQARGGASAGCGMSGGADPSPNRDAVRMALVMLAEESRLVGAPDAADLIEQAIEKLRQRMN